MTAIDDLKAALREAILCTERTGWNAATSDIDWLPQVKKWAELAELDLDQYDPYFYCTDSIPTNAGISTCGDKP